MTKPELLAPAGSPEALKAAVQAGAGAVYLGAGDLNARRGAKNFTPAQLEEAVHYCRLRGVKVYLTMNTLLTDRELAQAAELGIQASSLGVDAVLVQDLGTAKVLKQCCPDLPLHGSTQMTVCDLDGIRACADLGLTRVVLARELPASELETLCKKSPLELEVFVHGALCLCYSGQCGFSAALGERSGNRGLCAQPCRLAYQRGGEQGRLLSLKDLCLIDRLQELSDMGIASLKIEGRMKRPEYVYLVTKVYADVLREGRAPTKEELQTLDAAFSRGFTQGYYDDHTGAHMMGTRPEGQKDPEELFAKARQVYEREESRKIPLTIRAFADPGKPLRVTAQDADGNRVLALGQPPEAAKKKGYFPQQLEEQLRKTGGTIYEPVEVSAQVQPGLAVPLSAINALRREALATLDNARSLPPMRTVRPYEPIPVERLPQTAPRLSASFRYLAQLSPDVLRSGVELVYLPCDEIAAHVQETAALVQAYPNIQFAVSLPRIVWERERPRLRQELTAAKKAGITQALLTHIGQVSLVKELGFIPRGDFTLGLLNSAAAQMLADMGFRSVTGCLEVRLEQLRDLKKPLELEMLVYGHLPMMVTQQDLMDPLGNDLTDRKGAVIPMVRSWGGRTELFNGLPLWLADRQEDWCITGATWARLFFLEETEEECAAVLEAFQDGAAPVGDFTRGAYYRNVR